MTSYAYGQFQQQNAMGQQPTGGLPTLGGGLTAPGMAATLGTPSTNPYGQPLTQAQPQAIPASAFDQQQQFLMGQNPQVQQLMQQVGQNPQVQQLMQQVQQTQQPQPYNPMGQMQPSQPFNPMGQMQPSQPFNPMLQQQQYQPYNPMGQMQAAQNPMMQRAPAMPPAPNSQQVRPENMRMQAMRNMQRMKGPKG